MSASTPHPNAGAMSCPQAVELLPWLLNGSLESEERHGLLAHLRSCAGCRRELDETAQAGRMMSAHIPSLALAEYAQGLSPRQADRERIERHLARCPTCRAEVEGAMPAEVLDFESARARRALVPRHRGAVRRLLAAAAVLSVVVSGAVLWNRAQRDLDTPHGAVGALASEAESSWGEEPGGPDPRPQQGLQPENAAIFADGFETGGNAGWQKASEASGMKL